MTKAEFYREAHPTSHGPLEGLVVLEACTTYAGPVAAAELADLGAEVIKCELPVTDDEAESLRAFLYSDAISPEFVRALVREYGDASIASAFLIQRETAPQYLEYLLRRYKGHFYRRRYPSLTLVDQ
jgi:hypothetical protein